MTRRIRGREVGAVRVRGVDEWLGEVTATDWVGIVISDFADDTV